MTRSEKRKVNRERYAEESRKFLEEKQREADAARARLPQMQAEEAAVVGDSHAHWGQRLKEATETVLGERTEADILLMSPLQIMETASKIAAVAGSWFKAADLASQLAPYQHPRLQSVTQTSGNPDVGRSDAALIEELNEIRSRTAAADRARVMGETLPQRTKRVGGAGESAVERSSGETPRPTLQ